MSQNKHTKAPWFVGHRLNSHETRICTVVGGEAIHGSEAAVTEWRHDASLIAAAPDLLEALELLIAETDPLILNAGEPWCRVRAAIRKARGDQP